MTKTNSKVIESLVKIINKDNNMVKVYDYTNDINYLVNKLTGDTKLLVNSYLNDYRTGTVSNNSFRKILKRMI